MKQYIIKLDSEMVARLLEDLAHLLENVRDINVMEISIRDEEWQHAVAVKVNGGAWGRPCYGEVTTES